MRRTNSSQSHLVNDFCGTQISGGVLGTVTTAAAEWFVTDPAVFSLEARNRDFCHFAGTDTREGTGTVLLLQQVPVPAREDSRDPESRGQVQRSLFGFPKAGLGTQQG